MMKEASRFPEASRPAHGNSQPAMSTRTANTHDPRPARERSRLVVFGMALAACLWAGCRTTAPHPDVPVSDTTVQRTYALHYVTFERCRVLLGPLGLRRVEAAPGDNLVLLEGTPDQLKRADLVLDLIDVPEEYGIELLGPASAVRTLPSNPQIATALGHLSIGTFEHPPAGGAGARAIDRKSVV
jgi:hypothetical protein